MADPTYTLKPLPFDPDALKGLISKQVVEWHHDKHQGGYVNKANEIEKSLAAADKTLANANYSAFGELKRRQSFNLSGIILHEIYWSNLGGDGTADASLEIVKQLVADFGSLDAWKVDFIATGMSSLGWAILARNPLTGKLENYLCDFHNNGAVWGAIPYVALDVFEHAYYRDYGPDRASYVKKFVDGLNWKSINTIFLGK